MRKLGNFIVCKHGWLVTANAQTKPFRRNRPSLIADIAQMGHTARSTCASPCGANEMIAEITWDLVMSEDMAFAEGCYRLDGCDWRVITASKAKGVYSVGIRTGVRWDSGVIGMNIVMPDDAKINAMVLLEMMSNVLGVSEWQEVRGPDSIVLR